MSRYLEHLPAGFQADDALGPFLGRFLLAFERVLTGLPGDPDGIERLLDSIQRYFIAGSEKDPPDSHAPESFLPWLAGWVAIALREDWDAETKRSFIQKAPGLYRIRGTRDCIYQMLSFCLPEQTELEIDDGGPEPRYFKVKFRIPGNAGLVARYERIARAVLDQEKPAHTYYGLTIKTPSLQIVNQPPGAKAPPGVVIGRTTLLGDA